MKLILTFDYELFGNGSGDLFDHVIYPTNEILRVCDKYNIKTTIFFEVVEYWVLKKEWEFGNNMGYNQNPIKAMEKQLQDAYKNGHDIQLHFHPQWLGAKFINNKWNLNLENWRLSDFQTIDGYDQEKLIQEGKKTLNEILKSIKLDYKPYILRAGGYNILPSESIGKAMLNTGVIVDSSVYPGGFEKGEYSNYDYKRTPLDKDYWFASIDDVSVPSAEDKQILEIPLFALPVKRWKKYNPIRIKSILINKKSAFETIKAKTAKTSILKKIKYWFEEESITWDFCLFNKKMNIIFFNYIENNLKSKRKTFVLVGHPKNFSSKKTLEGLITEAHRRNYSFTTLENYAANILDNYNKNT